MKFLPIIWKGIWHNPLRTALTTVTIVVAFTLFGLLQGVSQGTNAIIGTFDSRLFTGNKFSVGAALPVAYLDKIKAVPGVSAVTHLTFFGGYYQDPRNTLPVFATNSDIFSVYSQDFRVSQAVKDAMAHSPTAAVVARPLAEKYGWKIGDRVPVRSSLWYRADGRDDYQFDIVGFIPVQPSAQNQMLGQMFFINYSYFDATRFSGRSTVHYFVSTVTDPARAGAIAKTIDAMFANSPAETVTAPESVMLQNQVRQAVDLGLVVNLIMSAVFITLLFVTANTIAQSVRERTGEIATMKALGFGDNTVAVLVACESLLLCLFAGAIGLTIARTLFLLLTRIFSIVMPVSVLLEGLGVSVLVAVVSGFLPAWRTRRLNLVAALANR